jgi:hypothetical protein
MKSYFRSLLAARGFFALKGAVVLLVAAVVVHLAGDARPIQALGVFSGYQSTYIAVIGSFIFCGAVVVACSPSVPFALIRPAFAPWQIFLMPVIAILAVLVITGLIFQQFDALNPFYSWLMAGGFALLACGLARSESGRVPLAICLCSVSMVLPGVLPDSSVAYALSVMAVLRGTEVPGATLGASSALWLIGGFLLARQVSYER